VHFRAQITDQPLDSDGLTGFKFAKKHDVAQARIGSFMRGDFARRRHGLRVLHRVLALLAQTFDAQFHHIARF
jgi:hypothetical protein